MTKKICFPLFCVSLLYASIARADMAVEPKDLPNILQSISQRQLENSAPPSASAEIIIKDDIIAFMQHSGETGAAATFSEKSPSIGKHVRLKLGADECTFSATLQSPGPYTHVIKKINGADALVFFNDEEVFVYTQTTDSRGIIELKEWIYARKPNVPQGSQWVWNFKAEPWDWPLTLDMNPDGTAKVNRHTPTPPGMPIDIRPRYQYMLNMMLKFKGGDPVKKYFPFSGEVSSIPPAVFWNKEGIKRQADIGTLNMSQVNINKPKPTHGLDFEGWDDYWQSIFKLAITAKPNEYPLLIDPSIVMAPSVVTNAN